MDYFSMVTTGPFDSRTYATVYNKLPAKKLLLSLFIFVVFQFILIVVPQLVFIPQNSIRTWNSLNKSLIPILKEEPFTYITISQGILTTDLQKQPYAISRADGVNKSFLIVDSTDDTTVASISKLPKTATGIFFTKENIVLRSSADTPIVISYARLMGKTATLTLSKNDILSFLDGGTTFSRAIAYLKKPSTIAVLVFYGGYLTLGYIGKQWLNLALIAAILCTLIFALMRKGPLRKLHFILPLSLFAAMGYWYITTIAGTIASYNSTIETILLPIAVILSPIYFLWIILSAITTIGKIEEEKLAATATIVVTPEPTKKKPKLSINKNATSHIGRHFKTKKIQYRRRYVRKAS